MILTDTQEQIQDSVRSFARTEIAPHAAEWEQAGAYPRKIFADLADIGLMGMTTLESTATRRGLPLPHQGARQPTRHTRHKTARSTQSLHRLVRPMDSIQ